MSVTATTSQTMATADIAVVNITAYYAELFAQLENQLPGAATSWLRAARRRALDRFLATGFPTTKQEEWKYSNISAIERNSFVVSVPTAATSLAPEVLAALNLEEFTGHRLVFVDGHYAAALSTLGELPAGVRIVDFATMLTQEPDRLSNHIHRYGDDNASPFVALNTAFVQDGAYINVADNTVLDAPIYIICITTDVSAARMHHLRIAVDAGRNSQFKLIEMYLGVGASKDLSNVLTEIRIAENAHIEHAQVQLQSLTGYHIANLILQQRRDSQVMTHSFALGGNLARTDIKAELAEPGAAVTLNGLYMGQSRQLIDHHTKIEHLAPYTNSLENYKGVLDGYTRGVFNGKVTVHPNAQKSSAQQSNKNLLLSAQAEADTKPELQIHADDVKCSHGATVGQLDEQALYYLRTRGIAEDTARQLLTYAFAEEMVAQVSIQPVRARLERLLIGQLPEF